MNGNQTNQAGKQLSIKDIHSQFLQNNNYKLLNFNEKKLKDHRKMIFFFEITDNSLLNKKILEKKDVGNFISSIDVCAILIGSTNQSYTSYFGKNNKADKGEADILLFNDTQIFNTITTDQNLQLNQEYGCLLSTTDISNIQQPTNDYLKQILNNFLEENLK